jgi:hypothetical protein
MKPVYIGWRRREKMPVVTRWSMFSLGERPEREDPAEDDTREPGPSGRHRKRYTEGILRTHGKPARPEDGHGNEDHGDHGAIALVDLVGLLEPLVHRPDGQSHEEQGDKEKEGSAHRIASSTLGHTASVTDSA